jgi:hypothetical protein
MKASFAIMVAIVAAGAIPAHADAGNYIPTGPHCIHVTATDGGDAAELRRALAAELPKSAGACLHVALLGVERVDRGAQVALTARVQVVVLDGDQIAAVVTGRATLHATKREARRRRNVLQHDVLDEVVARVMPAVRSRLVAPHVR